MTGRPDPIEAWRDVSATAARSTGYRAGPSAHRSSGLVSIGVMTVALAIIVAGLALRPATSGIGVTGPVSATTDDGMFRLELTTPRGTYGPGEAIEPVARVTYLGPDRAVTVAHSQSRLVFQIDEVGGQRQMAGGSRLSCESTNLVKGEPLVVPFGKSGSPDDPAKGFDLAWYQDPTLTLPVGTWRITANMDFSIGGCGGSSHVLHASNVVRVIAPTGDGPVIDRAEDGMFRLELATPRRIYGPQDAIEPVATVTFLGPDAEKSIYHGGSIVGWSIEEVGGNRTLPGGMTAVCATSTMRQDTPLAFPFAKSGPIGGFGETFDQAWFDDPQLHLPAGTWRIRAYTTISTDDGPPPSDGSFTCGTKGHGLEVENVITIGDGTPPSDPQNQPTSRPSPSERPSPSASPSPVVSSTADGSFRFELSMPSTHYTTADEIDPVATLTYIGSDGTKTVFHAASPILFRIDEVWGTQTMDGGMDTPCLSTELASGTGKSYPFEKSGSPTDDPAAGFDQAWYEDPVLHLPPGQWRITAQLDVYVGGCGPDAERHQLTTSAEVTVVPATGSNGPLSASKDDGTLRLTLTTPRETYGADEAIEPIAAVSYLGPSAETTIYTGDPPVVFSIQELGGGRRMDPAQSMPCVDTVVDQAAPVTFPFVKSGVMTSFDQAWYDDPVLRLPVGTWRIRATLMAETTDGTDPCGGIPHNFDVDNVIVVVADTPAPLPSAVPTAEPPGPIPVASDDESFRLELTIPRDAYTTEDAIEPVATLTYLGPQDLTSFGHSDPAVGFSIRQLDGDAQMTGIAADSCTVTRISQNEPVTFAFRKSGQVGLGFNEAWFGDPVLRLLPGTWRISAWFEGDIPPCDPSGTTHRLRVDRVITVR